MRGGEEPRRNMNDAYRRWKADAASMRGGEEPRRNYPLIGRDGGTARLQ